MVVPENRIDKWLDEVAEVAREAYYLADEILMKTNTIQQLVELIKNERLPLPDCEKCTSGNIDVIAPTLMQCRDCGHKQRKTKTKLVIIERKRGK